MTSHDTFRSLPGASLPRRSDPDSPASKLAAAAAARIAAPDPVLPVCRRGGTAYPAPAPVGEGAEHEPTARGLLVVSLEQAVAAPFLTARLADAGARVIKLERREGDFARGYDNYVRGSSTYFVYLNRGKQSLVIDIKDEDDRALLHRILASADVWVQNLAPGAVERAGFGSADLRARYPRLITVDISGYGETGRPTTG